MSQLPELAANTPNKMKRSHAMPMETALTQPSQELNESHVCDWEPVCTLRHSGPKECAARKVFFLLCSWVNKRCEALRSKLLDTAYPKLPSPIETTTRWSPRDVSRLQYGRATYKCRWMTCVQSHRAGENANHLRIPCPWSLPAEWGGVLSFE